MNVAAATAAVLSLAGSSLAVVVVDEAQYIVRPNGAVVGRLGGGSCVPIGARFALTANHVTVSAGKTIRLDGRSYTITNVFPHPNAPSVDLKILEIEGPSSFPEWVQVHQDPDSVPVGTPIYIGGWGKTTSYADGSCVEWGTRLERWAMNEVQGHIAGNWTWYRFDIEQPNEGIVAAQDSGSPMLIADPDNCSMSLLAVASTATSGTSGPSCDNNTAHYVNVDPLWLAQFTGPACLGDLDRDGDTDVSDFGLFISNFGAVSPVSVCGAAIEGDFNADGAVDVSDFALFVNDFGCGSDAP